MSDEEGMEYLVQTDQEKASESQVCSVIRATRFLHASGTYKGNDVKFSIFNLVHWLLSMFLIVTIVTIHQVATC